MSIEIDDMDPDVSIGGAEVIPVSDAGSPKSITPAGISAYTIDQIEATGAGTTPTGDDSIFILQGGVLVPVDIDLIAAHTLTAMWAKSAESAPDTADLMTLLDGSTEKTVTLALLATLIKTTIRTAVLNVTDLATTSLVDTTEFLAVTAGGVPGSTTKLALTTAIYAGLNAYLIALFAATPVTVPADADIFYVSQGGSQKGVSLAVLKTVLGSTIAPASTTENSVPQWSSASKTLKDGLTLVTAVRATGAALDTSLATEQAIREEFTALATSYDEIWVPANLMVPATTDGAAASDVEYTTSAITLAQLVFAGTVADDNAHWAMIMPAEWNLGTLKAKLYWAPGDAAANPGEYVGFYISGNAYANDDDLDTAVGGSEQLLSDIALADDDLHISSASSAITVGGSPALGELVNFTLRRDYDYAGAGTAMDVDARVFGILLQYQKANVVSAW